MLDCGLGYWAGGRSWYDEGKRTTETLTMDYHRGLNVEVIYTCSVFQFSSCKYNKNTYKETIVDFHPLINCFTGDIARFFNTYGPQVYR